MFLWSGFCWDLEWDGEREEREHCADTPVFRLFSLYVLLYVHRVGMMYVCIYVYETMSKEINLEYIVLNVPLGLS